jgi:hypothetical protein
MISGGFDRNVIVLDIEKLSIVKTFKGHNAAVTQVGATKYVYNLCILLLLLILLLLVLVI